jgi:hypothetical protein
MGAAPRPRRVGVRCGPPVEQGHRLRGLGSGGPSGRELARRFDPGPDIDDHTPNTGVVVFVDSGGVTRKIDFLGTPLGLRVQDVCDTAVRVTGADGVSVWVMHPERCMESRVYNVQILRRDDDHAMGQLSASIVIAREWSRFLLGDDSRPERDRVRAVLRLNERIFRKCLRDLHFRGLFIERGIDPFEAVLSDDDRLPAPFRERRYPQMRERLSERRRGGA